MIYIFEDRKGRMNQYYNSKFDTEILKEGIFDCFKDEMNLYINNNFQHADAVLFHKSYTFSNTGISSDDVKNLFFEKKIPFVYFSGGLKNSIILLDGINNGNVNSGDMYNNLSQFLDDYKQTGNVNIPLLIFGNKYLINSLLHMQFIVNSYFIDREMSSILTETDCDFLIDEALDVTLLENEFIKLKNTLAEWIECERNEKQADIKTLMNKIQELIDKY